MAKGKKLSSKNAASENGDNRPALPSWPAMTPLTPVEDLILQQVMPGQVVTVSNYWTSTLCKTYVRFLSSLPLTTTPGAPKRGEAVRVNDRFQVDDAAFAELLWSSGLKQIVLEAERKGTGEAEGDDKVNQGSAIWGGEVVGLNPNIRIYRYRPGQFFEKHYDDSNNVTIPGEPPTPARTTWTLLLYLTSAAEGCAGGETVFYPDPPAGKKRPAPAPLVTHLETGMALLHKHGRDCMLHEGREVTAGEKWVIRSDLCVRR